MEIIYDVFIGLEKFGVVIDLLIEEEEGWFFE